MFDLFFSVCVFYELVDESLSINIKIIMIASEEQTFLPSVAKVLALQKKIKYFQISLDNKTTNNKET